MNSMHFLVIILLLAGCTEEREPIPQLSADFASTSIVLEPSEQDRMVNIELNRVPLLPTIVEVILTNADGTSYGVDYITNPPAVNDTIDVDFPYGSTESSLSISMLKLAEDNEQRSFMLTIVSVSNNGLPGSNDELTVTLE